MVNENWNLNKDIEQRSRVKTVKPPMTIKLPKGIRPSVSSSNDSSVEYTTDSMGSDGLPIISPVTIVTKPTPEHNNILRMTGSFGQRFLDSESFFTDTAEESETREKESLSSRLGSNEDEIYANLTRPQLLDLIEELYSSLDKANLAASNDKKRRRDREQTIVKLAKELSRQRDTIYQQKEQIDEVREKHLYLVCISLLL